MGIIETFLVFPVAALDLAVVPRRVRTDQLVTDSQASGSVFKLSQFIALAGGETVGKLEAVVRLDAFNLDTVPCIPGDSFFKEVGGRKCALLVVSAQETEPGKLVNGGVLIEPQDLSQILCKRPISV